MWNRRGSASVFLVFIMTAMIGAAAAFIYMSKHTAYGGISDGVVNLAMRSVLAEFDVTLKDRYGLFAFEKSGLETAIEINDDLDCVFDTLTPIKKMEISFDKYCLLDITPLKKQIIKYMKFSIAENLLMENRKNFKREQVENRTLRNKAVIESLPSKPFKGSMDFLDRIEQIKNKITSTDEIFDKTKDTYILNSYILNHFKYATGGPVDETSFFEHEVEYILAGNFSDKENQKEVQTGMKILRTALNAMYLYSDEEKRELTLAAAEVLNPGAAVTTQAVIIATWSAAEAKNDMKLLLDGKCVPFMKDKASWATDLDKVLENITEDYIDTGVTEGLHYDDYLAIFLYFQDEPLKLARIADLIQINMKVTQSRDFLMRTCNAGFCLKAKRYGKDCEYETQY